MTVRICWLYVNRAMQRFMQSVESDGTITDCGSRDSHRRNLLEDFCVTVVAAGAVYFSTVKFPWNGRGVTRTKTGNQTGD